MTSSQTETADYSASLLTRLYVFALSGIAALLIGGQFIVQQSIFKNSGDARIVNTAGRQRAFSQRIAKCALAIDYADNADESVRYTHELEKAVKQCVLEHESLQFGANNVVVTQQYSPEMHNLFATLESPYQTMIKEARAIIARQRAEPFDPSREKSVSRYTASILTVEPVVLEGLEKILTEIVNESGRRSDDLAQTELSLLLATLLCLLLVALVIFRPAIDQIRTIIRAMENMQNRLDGTISSMGEALFQIDRDGSISFINVMFENLLGYTFVEVHGKKIHEIVHVVDEEHARECAFVNVTNFNDSVQIMDDVFRRKDGTTFPAQIVSSPVMRRGERVGAVVTFRDVTERILLERRLTAQHEITLILQEANSVEEALPKILSTLCRCFELEVGSVWFINPVKAALECVLVQHPHREEFDEFDAICKKRSFLINEGIPGRIWKTKDALYVANVFDKPELVIRAPQLAKANLKSAFAFPIIQSQKVMGVIEFFGHELREPDEQLLTLVASTSNQIGEFVQRKRTEMHLITSEARLGAIINTMAEGVIVADVNGLFLLINQAAKVMHKMPHEDSQIADWTKLFIYYGADKKTTIPDAELPLLRAIHGESVDNMEIFLQPVSGEAGVWLSATARPLRDEANHLIGGVVVMNNITERKDTERRLSEFYSTVSHELRTPLTSIKAALGLLEGGIAGDLSTKAMQLVSVGRSESDRLVRLINDILDVKKMEDGKFELQIVEVDMAQLIEQSITGLEAILSQSDLKIETSIHLPAIVLGDRDRLTQVLYNLLSNAIKFSPNGGTIRVNVEDEPGVERDVMRVSVSDQGRGIPEDQIHLLFGMFQQLGAGENRPPGTGLGLAICKKIVELHDGKIGLESKPGEGATFWFELPVRQVSAVLS